MSDIKKIQEYWDARPCNKRHSQSEIGTVEYFNEVEARRYKIEPHNYAFAEFPLWKDKRVLEIGCGIGTDAINFMRHGADYTGIDLSKESLDLAQQRADVFGLKGKFVHGNAEDLVSLIDKQTFDLIYSFGVIHHAPTPQHIVDHLPFYCHKDTIVKCMLYAKHSWKNILIEAGLSQVEAQDNCPKAETYTKEEVIEMFDKFNVIIKQDFIFPWQIDKYVNYEYEKEPWFENMPYEMLRAFEKKLGWHLLIEGKLKV